MNMDSTYYQNQSISSQPLAKSSPETITPIDEVIERIIKLTQSTSDIANNLNNNDDRVRGSDDRVRGSQPCSAEANLIGGIKIEGYNPPLFELLRIAIENLEHQHELLANAAKRNCWAI